ncbi:MAG: hypothetical protein P8Y95_07805 [Gammaproteobacteria bacterium]
MFWFWILAATYAALPAWCLGGESPRDDWLLVPGTRAGPITASTSEAVLAEIFGPSNVSTLPLDIGEEMYETGTIVFEADPSRRIEILWRDQHLRRHPRRISVKGSQSRWHLSRGIGLGTTLEELEALNGGPFVLAGWGWDYGGTIYDWRGGLLAPIEVTKKVWIRLAAGGWQELSDEERSSIRGDVEYLSSLPILATLDPRVEAVSISIGR